MWRVSHEPSEIMLYLNNMDMLVPECNWSSWAPFMKTNTTLQSFPTHPCSHEALICLEASSFLYVSLNIRPSHIKLCVVVFSSGSGGERLTLALRCVCHRRNVPSPSGPSAHELRVALCARNYDVHPDPHGLWGGGHHVVEAVMGLHAEGQRWIWALEDHRETVQTWGCTCCIFNRQGHL